MQMAENVTDLTGIGVLMSFTNFQYSTNIVYCA